MDEEHKRSKVRAGGSVKVNVKNKTKQKKNKQKRTGGTLKVREGLDRCKGAKRTGGDLGRWYSEGG